MISCIFHLIKNYKVTLNLIISSLVTMCTIIYAWRGMNMRFAFQILKNMVFQALLSKFKRIQFLGHFDLLYVYCLVSFRSKVAPLSFFHF